MAVIFVASSIPDLQTLPGHVSDKTAHFSVYAGLALALLRGRANMRWTEMTWRTGLWAVGVSGLYGVTDEWHQGFVPGRTVSAADWVADITGAAVAVAAALAVARVVAHVRRQP